jgi:lipoprotein-anchoring transpeptidase ErfK/SrfK
MTYSRRAILALLPAAALTACTADMGAGPRVQTPPADTAYVSRMDGRYQIEAIPLEKLPEPLRRQSVRYDSDEAPGTIIIHPGERFLYFVTGRRTAIRYGIAVGREGFEWAGEAVVARTRPWPTWTPPPEMIDRDPKLAKWAKGQPGGPANPLGARAIYLTTNGIDYGYRIHGTPEWWSIGRNASSGCIRMINQDVIDLNERVQTGAKVIVLQADGSRAPRLIVPPPAPRKPRVTPKPAAATVSAPVVTPVAGPV